LLIPGRFFCWWGLGRLAVNSSFLISLHCELFTIPAMTFKNNIHDKLTVSYLLLVISLIFHVIDEAVNHFLDFYNPLVIKLREYSSLFPFPVFSFKIWIIGLALLILVLIIITPLIYRRNRIILLITRIFAILMVFNGLGHIAFSIYYVRIIPGMLSSPILFFFSVYFFYRVHLNNRSVSSI
jgi:hypothetical protein